MSEKHKKEIPDLNSLTREELALLISVYERRGTGPSGPCAGRRLENTVGQGDGPHRRPGDPAKKGRKKSRA